jgi:dTDP-4-dehydrorhamnose reductase
MNHQSILVTGGSGLLGSELKKLLNDANFPSSKDFNIINFEQMDNYIANSKTDISILLHCAAFTSPPKIDKEPINAIDTNIIGTSNVVKLCMKHNIKLIYISTDYVFDGAKGNYKEEDAVFPVNKYAWSKLGGEAAIRMYDNSLIIRLSFGPDIFPYEKAFVDQWTTRESVTVTANKIYKLLETDITGLIHMGGSRKTVLDYAKSLDPSKNILPISVKDMNFKIPVDTSLNTDLYNQKTKN